MPRQATGEILTRMLADGRTMFLMRFRAYGVRRKIKLGTDAEGWNQTRAENHLTETMDQVRRKVWQPPDTSRSATPNDPTFHEFASGWFARKRGGIKPRTDADYSWKLSNHLLPFFKAARLSEIDVAMVDRYRQAKLAERNELRAVGQRALSNDSINGTLALLAQILDEAGEHKLPVEVPNPAKGKRRRLKTQRAKRTFLEPDQAAAMIEAARRLDADARLTWEKVCEIRASTESNVKVAQLYGVSDSFVSRIRRDLAWTTPAADVRRTPMVATLVLAGPRIEEFCALNVGDVDMTNRRLLIEDAKTEAGVRPITMSDLLAEEVAAHLDRMGPMGPDAPLYPNSHGERYTPSGVRAVLASVVERASALLAEGGGRMPKDVTPHTLRRTFISLLLAGGADVPWVMAQVGHTDPKVTLQIYAQVVQGRQRDYGERVDQMIHGVTFGSANGSKSVAGADCSSSATPGRVTESQ